MSKASRTPSSKASKAPVIERMEDRVLLSATPVTPLKKAPPAFVTAYTMDNRGEAQFTFSRGIDKSTVTRFVAAIYTAGNDGNLGTSDDVRMRTGVNYRRGILTLNADTALNQRYRVILNASYIKDENGRFIDGEFNGDGVRSGDTVPGGNVDVMTATPGRTRVRYNTPQGPIVVALYKNTPNIKANFVNYANVAKWDSTIMHRSVKKADGGIDIVQGGGFRMNTKANTTTTLTEDHGDVANEATNLNSAGTLAMANAGANTNNLEWFFNVTDNTFLDTNPGQYTVFGAVEKTSMRSMQALLSAYVDSGDTQLPLGDPAQGRENVPVVSIPAINARGSISPKDDYVYFSRISVLNDVVATSVSPASVRTSAAPAVVAPAATNGPAVVAKPAAAVFASKKEISADDSVLS